jgi:hypothetical protein
MDFSLFSRIIKENLPMSNQNVSLLLLAPNDVSLNSISQQRRFSENPSNRIWESEEPHHSSPLKENIELVDIHPEYTESTSKTSNSTKKMLIKLPTLSISGPSRNQSPTSPTEEETGKFL